MRHDNVLVCGDNVLVMRAHERAWAERFRLAYLDPPFNTGRRFVEYDDAHDPKKWAARLRETVEAVLPLITRDGTIACEIDDTELGSLIETGDAVLGGTTGWRSSRSCEALQRGTRPRTADL